MALKTVRSRRKVAAKRGASAHRRTTRRTPRSNGAARRTSRRTSRLRPFTVPHFVSWSKDLELEDDAGRVKWEPFQIAFIADLFLGLLENWLVLPEGNGKSTLIAAIVLYHLDMRLGGYVPVAASSRDQAEILYRQMEGFVLRTPRLRKLFKCLEGYRRIRHLKTRSRCQIMAADAVTNDGIIPSLAITEELHRHKDLGLYRVWRGKMRKRKGAQIAAISTAGEPYSEFENVRDKIRKLPGAVIKGSFLRVIGEQIVMHDYAVPPKSDVTDLKLVKAANPFSAVTVDTLREDFESPSMTIEHWSRFKANVATRSSAAAITEREWTEALAKKTAIPAGVPVKVGLDIGWKWDTTAIVPMWERDENFRLLGRTRILVPPRDSTSLDPEDIYLALADLAKTNPIELIVMDTTRSNDVAKTIEREYPDAEVLDWTQSDANAVIEFDLFMEGLRSGWLWHSGDADLTRHVMNAIARMLRSGKSMFDRPVQSRQTRSKQKQDARVIDGLKAASMILAALYGGKLGGKVELKAS